ncbi:UNVERIFIED_CONTAM: hypothetical protein Sradi_5157700 [Sesamum radiatum]|uniref:Uncharacterized protein n=1 Tax=Sesamum radiatum TaxID=300843 RepID=A0AAW2M4V8_SESRA
MAMAPPSTCAHVDCAALASNAPSYTMFPSMGDLPLVSDPGFDPPDDDFWLQQEATTY